jgi:DNA-binding CsgD family transcriptional regulator
MKSSINNNDETNDCEFTPYQIRIIDNWAKLKTSASAAAALGIKEQTVLTHLRRMRLKLGVKRTVDVYIYMVQENLL